MRSVLARLAFGLVPRLVSAAALTMLAACTHDFDQFVITDASAEGGSSGGEGGSGADAGCGAPQSCLANAGNCVITCDKTRDNCLSNCSNNGCKQNCQNASTTCRSDCANTCTQCSQQAGCNGATDCAAATK